jgi:hypothetical protein
MKTWKWDMKQEYKYDGIVSEWYMNLKIIHYSLKWSWYITVKGVVVICYEKKMQNLDTFFDMIIPLFRFPWITYSRNIENLEAQNISWYSQ